MLPHPRNLGGKYPPLGRILTCATFRLSLPLQLVRQDWCDKMANAMERDIDELEAMLSSSSDGTRAGLAGGAAAAASSSDKEAPFPGSYTTSNASNSLLRAHKLPTTTFRPLMMPNPTATMRTSRPLQFAVPQQQTYVQPQQQQRAVQSGPSTLTQHHQQQTMRQAPFQSMNGSSDDETHQIYGMQVNGGTVLVKKTPHGWKEAFPRASSLPFSFFSAPPFWLMTHSVNSSCKEQETSSPSPMMHAPAPFGPAQFYRDQQHLAEYDTRDYDDDRYDSPSRQHQRSSSRKRTNSNSDRGLERMEKRYRRDMKEMEREMQKYKFELQMIRTQMAGPHAPNGSNSNRHRSSSPLRDARPNSPSPVRHLPPHNINTDQEMHPSSSSSMQYHQNGQPRSHLGQYQQRPPMVQQQNRQIAGPSGVPAVVAAARGSSSEPHNLPIGPPVAMGKYNFQPTPRLPREGEIVPPLDSKHGIGMLSTTVLRKPIFI